MTTGHGGTSSRVIIGRREPSALLELYFYLNKQFNRNTASTLPCALFLMLIVNVHGQIACTTFRLHCYKAILAIDAVNLAGRSLAEALESVSRKKESNENGPLEFLLKIRYNDNYKSFRFIQKVEMFLLLVTLLLLLKIKLHLSLFAMSTLLFL